jgi:hypothetical protein
VARRIRKDEPSEAGGQEPIRASLPLAAKASCSKIKKWSVTPKKFQKFYFNFSPLAAVDTRTAKIMRSLLFCLAASVG